MTEVIRHILESIDRKERKALVEREPLKNLRLSTKKRDGSVIPRLGELNRLYESV